LECDVAPACRTDSAGAAKRRHGRQCRPSRRILNTRWRIRSVTAFAVTFLCCVGIWFIVSSPARFTLAHAQASPPNVLLITLDTVRADRIGAYGYAKGSTPVLDRLAREGIRFADATTQAPLTAPAHAALLTGLYPARIGVRDNATTPVPDGVTTAAEAFKAKGYRTGGFVGAFILTAPYGFAQGFDTFDADFQGFTDGGKLQVQRRGDAVVDRALQWLDGAGSQPFFGWVHLYDAHAPYEAPPPFGARFKTSPYDGEIAYVDACIGRLVASLERSGRLDRTIVSVVADHGEGLGEHGEQEHGMFLYEEVLRIPWIVRLPGRAHAGRIVSETVRAIDVLPTLAALAAVTLPRVDGESVAGLVAGIARRETPSSYAETFYPKWHYGWSELKSLRGDRWKYIDAPKPEIYDLRADPAELRNVAAGRGPLMAGMSGELARIESGFGAAAATDAPQPDAETLARLRSLGYAGMAGPSRPGVRGPDPKDMIAGAEAFRSGISRAIDALARNEPAAAIAQLERLLAVNDRSYELHLFLGDAYVATRQFESALGEYAAAGVLNPRSAAPALSAARAYLAQGNTTRALEKAAEAARIEPGSGDIAVVRGQIHERSGQTSQAMDDYSAAVRANPSDPQARARLASLAMRTRQFDAAQPQFEALLRLGYRPARMHFGLAQIAEGKGDRARAVSEYREAVRLEPGFADAKAALARIEKR
jgi:arylsulfatase A-like enzyme/Tfp pilus assembly protein PilF